MNPRFVRAIGAVLLAFFWVSPAFAVDKEHRQLAADLRMLQEQSQQLQNLLGTITEAIKALNAKIDDQTNANRKGLADQKLIIDNLTNDVRIIREKLDDNNVRIGSLTQEVDALRQALQQAAARSAVTDSSAAAGTPDAAAPTATGQPAPVAIGTSPQRLWDEALSDYTLAQWDLAIAGFQAYIKNFPKSDMADDAQVYIGNCYLQAGKNDKAVEAYDVAIRTYPGGNAIPEAYYRKGLALKNLRQPDRAREAFEMVVKNYPDSAAATLAQQQLVQPR
jgi:tol-pal system protein YbgF